MISVMLAALCSPALAQQRGGGRVDPAYQDYSAALDEIGSLDHAGSSDPQPQLWPGMVGFVDVYGQRLGTVFVGGSFPQMQESWYLPAEVDPGAPFGLVHEDGYPPGTEAGLLAAEDPDWDLNPCFDMHVKYTQVPNATLTGHLDYTVGIDRYAFVMLQGGQVVGRMLREHHRVPNTPERFVDHWAFYDSYEPPAALGEAVWVLEGQVQFATTSAWFADLQQDPGLYWGFAQIQYKPLLGFQCLSQLTF